MKKAVYAVINEVLDIVKDFDLDSVRLLLEVIEQEVERLESDGHKDL